MNRAELRRYARLGAEARVETLQRELEAIYRVFPYLRGDQSSANFYTAGVREAVSGVRRAVDGAVRRKRRTRSPEARQRMAEAQRKRWAELRARQAAATGTSQKVPTEKPSVSGGSPKKK